MGALCRFASLHGTVLSPLPHPSCRCTSKPHPQHAYCRSRGRPLPGQALLLRTFFCTSYCYAPAADSDSVPLPGQALLMRTFQLPGKGRVRLTLLPPPSNRGDLMAVVDIGRAAEVRGRRGKMGWGSSVRNGGGERGGRAALGLTSVGSQWLGA